jgi:hypothetical protein
VSNDLLAAEPLIPSTMPAEKAASFGQQVPRAPVSRRSWPWPSAGFRRGELHDRRGGAGHGRAADAVRTAAGSARRCRPKIIRSSTPAGLACGSILFSGATASKTVIF